MVNAFEGIMMMNHIDVREPKEEVTALESFKENGKKKAFMNKTVNVKTFDFYENEQKQLIDMELSPCKKFLSVVDSFKNIYIYKCCETSIVFLFKLEICTSSSIRSTLWISKNRKSHLFKYNEYDDYLLIVTTFSGGIFFYDIGTKQMVYQIKTSGCISNCKIDNSLHSFGFTNLNGYFYYYNIYNVEPTIIYNCYDKFYLEKDNEKEPKEEGETMYLTSKKFKNSICYNTDLSTVPPTELIHEGTVHQLEKEKEEEKEKETQSFYIYLKSNFKSKEKLVCLYFMDILKSRKVLLHSMDASVQSQKEKEAKKRKRRKQQNEKDIWCKKIRKAERTYDNYHHYVLLGTDQSRIFKFDLEKKICVGEFQTMSKKKCIIWDLIYIYKTDEVLCVDNQGDLFVFDNSQYSIKYHFSNHTYKAVTIAKSTNEEVVYTSGADRHIVKYTLMDDKPEKKVLTETSKILEQTIKEEEEEEKEKEENTQVNKSNLKKCFYSSQWKEFRKKKKKDWQVNSKNAAHMCDIKKIININEKNILTLSDDFTICFYDMIGNSKNYFSIKDSGNTHCVQFSKKMDKLFCIYSKNIKIYYNCCFSKKENRETEKESLTNLSFINPSFFKYIANITFKEDEYLNTCKIDETGNNILCKKNENFSIIHFDMNQLQIYNHDLTNIQFSKIYDFTFVNHQCIILSLMKEKSKKKKEKKEKEKGKGKGKEREANVSEKFNNEINENLHHIKKRCKHYVVIYDMEEKTIKEKLNTTGTLINFKIYNDKNGKGVVVCSDYSKNIYVFFHNSMNYLSEYIILKEFNIETNYSSEMAIFYFIFEGFLFICTSKDNVFVYEMNLETKKIRLRRKIFRVNINFTQFKECVPLGFDVPDSFDIQMKNKTHNNACIHDCTDIKSDVPPFVLLLKRSNQMELVGFNITNTNSVQVQMINNEGKVKLDNNLYSQFYLPSLKFKYNFLNMKHIVYEYPEVYMSIFKELSTCDFSIPRVFDEYLTKTNELKQRKQQIEEEEREEQRNFEMGVYKKGSLEDQFIKLWEYKTKHIVDVHFINQDDKQMCLILCLPKYRGNTEFKTADTKKYVSRN